MLLRHDPDSRVRRAAAHAVTCGFEPRSAAVLIPVIDDVAEEPSIRAQAAEGIDNVLDVMQGSPPLRARTIAALGRGLTDPSVEVRF